MQKSYHLPYHILFSLFILFNAWSPAITAQGCVAIKHYGACDANSFTNAELMGEGWSFGLSYLYFKSDRHFRGDHEEADRQINNTEVINHAHTANLDLFYNADSRLSFGLSLPLVFFTRSSLYEHGLVNGEYLKRERRQTASQGIGDIRLSANYWLRDPALSTINLNLGLGIKLPTGDYRAEDVFYNVGEEGGWKVRPVDQSIQPGDGGIGFTAQMQGYAQIAARSWLFADGFYLFNPRNTNGTRTFRETLVPLLLDNEAIMSTPDQYYARLGVSQNGLFGTSLNALLAGRIEGIPVRDAIGKSRGFRRPGYVLSVEPGLNLMAGRHNISFSVPIAVRRNRLQSLTDKETEELTGIPRHGDAAFADYSINLTYQIRIGRKENKLDIFDENN